MNGHCVKFNLKTRSVIITTDLNEVNDWAILFKATSNCVINDTTHSFCEVYCMGLMQGDPTIKKL